MAFTRKEFEEAAHVVRQSISIAPQIGMILGSGLGTFADSVQDATIIPYTDIPHWSHTTVSGHKGRLVIGEIEGQRVLVMQGRSHFYEGYSMHETTFPVRVMQVLGLHTLIVTNAAGGVNPDFDAGDLMLINDHLNLPGMTGHNPLRGPNDESLGTRFPDLSSAYDKNLRDLAKKIAKEEDIALREGVYAYLSGPTFESPAEIRMIRGWGADAVGMSTAPEVVVAVHGGMRVLGISSITNATIDHIDSTQQTNHEEVLETGKQIMPRLTRLLHGILREMPSPQ